MLPVVLALSLAGCIREIPPGPEFGRCAEVPEGTYTFGEAGIGTCLAGPADLRFFQQDGGTFLAVVNADPFREFATGSLLVVDWDEVWPRIDASAGPVRLTMDELEPWALPIADDDDGDGEGASAYLGGFGYLAAHQAAIVTSRLTEGAVLRSGRDEAFLVDLSRMELGRDGIELLGSIELEDDPMPVVVDDASERVYVGNLTDHSVSVLTSDPQLPPLPDLPVAEIDVAPGARATAGAYDDVDGDGGLATLERLAVLDDVEITEDLWTLTYIDGTVRLWVPTPVDDEVRGVTRYSTAGAGWEASPFGLDEGLGDVRDPFFEVDPNGVSLLYFARPDGSLWRAYAPTSAGSWTVDSEPLLAQGLRGSPSAAPLPGEIGLYHDARDDADADAFVALATSTDALVFDDQGAVLVPPAGTSYEDPFVALDPLAGRYRMWLTVRVGDRTDIGLSESDDGFLWSEPRIIVPDAAAPTVGLLEGRYALWYAISDGTSWHTAEAWSYDGRDWSAPGFVVGTELPYDPTDPPRVAAQVDRVGAWRLDGLDQPPLSSLLAAGTGQALELYGFEIAVSQGQEIDNAVVDGLRARQGLVPGAVYHAGGRRLMAATATDSASHDRIVLLQDTPGGWAEVVGPGAMDTMLGIGGAEQASNPTVAEDAEGLVMFYAVARGDGTRLRRATSTDGLTWVPDASPSLLADDADIGWDSVAQLPHAVEFDGARVRLWYTGDDGSRFRIGSATSGSLRGAFAREPGATTDWRFGTGLPGGFDDSSVKDPLIVRIGDQTHLYYAGFDGTAWHLGHATMDDRGAFTRRVDPSTDLPMQAMSGLTRTFSALGVVSPTLLSQGDDTLELLYAGSDGLQLATGRAVIDPLSPDAVYPAQRFPTSGDQLTFETTRGGPGAQVVELGQLVQAFGTTGWGMSSLSLDPDRGFLYATSKLDEHVYVVDVRDDSSGTFTDRNVLDLETLIRIDAGPSAAGFRDAAVSRTRSLLYLTQRLPDALVVLDLARVDDDEDKEVTNLAAVAVMPLPDLDRDAGGNTLAQIGGAGMALSTDERMLLITHFRGNALSVWDLTLGAWGEEIAWIQGVGENPHVVRISPDGRYAVVANYLGDLDGETPSSTLAVVDLDPASDTYLEIVAWLANQ